MNNNRLCLCATSAVLMLLAWPLRAVETDEAKLQTEQRRLDQDKTTADAQKTVNLAKQFSVSEMTVQNLRDKGQGWGEITIGLAEAQQLSKNDPKTYPTLDDALAKIQSLRAEGAGWGKIANDLGFKLGPVISEAQHARHEMRESVRTEKTERERAGRPEKTERPPRPEHPSNRPGR